MRTTMMLVALLALGACSEATPETPAPAAQSAEAEGAAALPAGHPDVGSALPAGHPSMDGALPMGHPGVEGEATDELDDPSVFAGRALLKGALAEAASGMLMVSLRPKGQRFPIWAYVVDLADPEAAKQGLAKAEGGARVFTFVLNKDTTLMRQPIPAGMELEVAVSYDPDGDVDTKDGQSIGVVPAKAGDDALVIELAPPAAKQ